MPLDAQVKLENPDVATRKVAALAFAFLAFVAVSLALLLAYFRLFDRGGAVSPPEAFPAPRLETRNAEDLDAILARQRNLLESYAVVDSQKHLVRIPVSRAMELIAARGAAAYDPLSAPPASENKAP